MGNSQWKTKTSDDKKMSQKMSPRPFFTSFSNLGRHWYKRIIPEHIEKTKNTNFEFTIASYNVLADKLMEDNPYLYYQGKRKDPKVFDWNYRKHNLLKEIKCANADVRIFTHFL